MIVSFRHKGLQELFEEGETRRLPQHRLGKIDDALHVIDSAIDPTDLNRPGFRLHRLKRPPLDGWYSMDISGNYRVVFRFTGGDAFDLDYLDTH